jgi:hypothetical protein
MSLTDTVLSNLLHSTLIVGERRHTNAARNTVRVASKAAININAAEDDIHQLEILKGRDRAGSIDSVGKFGHIVSWLILIVNIKTPPSSFLS